MGSALIKVSGKIVSPDNAQLIKSYAGAIEKLVDKGYRIAVVVGGGPYARKYIECAKSLTANQAFADIVGIEIARVNALLLAGALGDLAYKPIPRNIAEVLAAWSSGKVVVVGGLQPGQSTSAVAAVVAETLGIKRIVYATDVEGVYDKDPKKYPDAKKLDEVTYDELSEILRSQRFEAGGYELIDPLAQAICKRSGIETIVVNGFNVENVVKAVMGKKVGTRVVPSR